jgi:hypothetical protein
LSISIQWHNVEDRLILNKATQRRALRDLVLRVLNDNPTEVPFLRSLLHRVDRDEFDVGHRPPLGLQQEISQVFIAASTVDQHANVSIDGLDYSEANLGPAVIQNALQMFQQRVGQLLERSQSLPLQLIHPFL